MAKAKPKTKPAKKRGPQPDRLVIPLDFEEAARRLTRTPKPAKGWPPQPPIYKKRSSEEE